jgi:hypothetical protein
LQLGDPLLPPIGELSRSEMVVVPPSGPALRLPAGQSPLLDAGLSEPGVYRLEADGKTTYYAVQADPRESVLTAASADEREAVRQLLPLTYEDDPSKLTLAAGGGRLELWSWVLVGVIVLLCAEVWLTRRITMNRS